MYIINIRGEVLNKEKLTGYKEDKNKNRTNSKN